MTATGLSFHNPLQASTMNVSCLAALRLTRPLRFLVRNSPKQTHHRSLRGTDWTTPSISLCLMHGFRSSSALTPLLSSHSRPTDWLGPYSEKLSFLLTCVLVGRLPHIFSYTLAPPDASKAAFQSDGALASVISVRSGLLRLELRSDLAFRKTRRL